MHPRDEDRTRHLLLMLNANTRRTRIVEQVGKWLAAARQETNLTKDERESLIALVKTYRDELAGQNLIGTRAGGVADEIARAETVIRKLEG